MPSLLASAKNSYEMAQGESDPVVFKTKDDLQELGVDLDQDTIDRIKKTLGGTLFASATKSAQLLRARKEVNTDSESVEEIPLWSRSSSIRSPGRGSGRGIPVSGRKSASKRLFSDDQSDEMMSEQSIEFGSASPVRAGPPSPPHSPLNFYRLQRSIMKTDINDIGNGELPEDLQASIIPDHATVLDSIDPAYRDDLDRLILELQYDYAKCSDKFIRRIFAYPTNAPKVEIKKIVKKRYLDPQYFHEAIVRCISANFSSDTGGAYVDEIIWSLYQLVYEEKRIPGEVERRPVVDIWKFLRMLKSTNYLHDKHVFESKKDIEEYKIHSKFYNAGKTYHAQPMVAPHVNHLDRETKANNHHLKASQMASEPTQTPRCAPPLRRVFTDFSVLNSSLFKKARDMHTVQESLNFNATDSSKSDRPVATNNFANNSSNVRALFMAGRPKIDHKAYENHHKSQLLEQDSKRKRDVSVNSTTSHAKPKQQMFEKDKNACDVPVALHQHDDIRGRYKFADVRKEPEKLVKNDLSKKFDDANKSGEYEKVKQKVTKLMMQSQDTVSKVLSSCSRASLSNRNNQGGMGSILNHG